VIATAPTHQMNSAIDPGEDRALDEEGAMQRAYCEAAAAGPSPRRAAGPRRLPGHRLDRRRRPQLLEAVDHHLLAVLQAFEHDPLSFLAPPSLSPAAG
jgi:hypothetical protein